MTAPTLADIFDRKLHTAEPLPLDEELDLIRRAQDGDFAAYNALLVQYATGLRSMASREYARAGEQVDPEETRANVLAAFALAVRTCDGTTRVAAKLKAATVRIADEFHIIGGLSVPTRTRQRTMQAMREAGVDGDPLQAAEALGMDSTTFIAAKAALAAGSLEAHHEYLMDRLGAGGLATDFFTSSATPLTTERGYATAEQVADVRRAFHAAEGAILRGELAADATGIVRDAYGFTEFDPIPDAEIAHRRGYSRSKVQRLRAECIGAMRAALVGDEEAGE